MLLVSCSEVLAPNGLSDQALSAGTKSPDAEYYYWYEGKRIGLILKYDYVNILVDTNMVNKHNFSELCSEIGLEASTDLSTIYLRDNFYANIKDINGRSKFGVFGCKIERKFQWSAEGSYYADGINCTVRPDLYIFNN